MFERPELLMALIAILVFVALARAGPTPPSTPGRGWDRLATSQKFALAIVALLLLAGLVRWCGGPS